MPNRTHIARLCALLVAAGLLAQCNEYDNCGTNAKCAPDSPLSQATLAKFSRLHTDNTVLRDAQNRQVILRGVNAGGRSKFAPFAPFDFDPTLAGDYTKQLGAYLDRAQSWGINVLRVPFTWQAVEPTRGHDDQAFLARYDELLDAAWQRRMWTIVDCHQDVYSEVFCGDGFPAWTLPAGTTATTGHHDCPQWFTAYNDNPQVQAAFDHFFANGDGVRDDFVAMWLRMAKRHRDRPGVIGLEILNEPGHTLAGLGQWQQTVLSPFFAEVATKLHAVAPEHLVFIDTSPFDAVIGSTQIQRPPGNFLVFAPHWYDASIYLGSAVDVAAPGAGIKAWQAQAAEWQAPLFIGESGYLYDKPLAGAGVAALLDAVDEQQASLAYWEYSVATEDWNGEHLGLVGPNGTARSTALGALIRPYPQRVAGGTAKWSWDGPNRTFEITLTGCEGACTALPALELSLPGFLKGYSAQVEVENAGCWQLPSSVFAGSPSWAQVTLEHQGVAACRSGIKPKWMKVRVVGL